MKLPKREVSKIHSQTCQTSSPNTEPSLPARAMIPGYNISMLKRLADKYPLSVAQLTLQYRMHGAICQLCNDIAYGGNLRCANEIIETSLLSLPGFPSAILKRSLIDSIGCWMTEVIDPSRPVVFVDTDSITSRTPFNGNSQSVMTPPTLEGAHPNSITSSLERTTGKKGKGNVVNDTEAVLVLQIVHGLLECGMETSQIGVICPFRSQVSRSSIVLEVLSPMLSHQSVYSLASPSGSKRIHGRVEVKRP